MKTIEKAMILVSDGAERFSSETFDRLKDLFRARGVVENNIFFYCGVTVFDQLLDGVTTDIRTASGPPEFIKEGVFTFTKNGIKYTCARDGHLDELMIVIRTGHYDHGGWVLN